MPLKINGERVKATYNVKRTTADKVRLLAEQTYRGQGQMLDKIVDEYVLKENKD